MGNKELAGIDAGLRPPQNRGTAQAGRILGIISTIILIISVVFLFVFLFIALIAGTT